MTAELDSLLGAGVRELRDEDPALHALLAEEQLRQESTLSLLAAASSAPPSVLACQGAALGNLTVEGYPGNRYHGGSLIADKIEELARERACALFSARHANVQPHSGSSANQAVLFGLLSPGDTILGMDLSSGGHLTHGASISISGRCFRATAYGVTAGGWLDLDQVRERAHAERPRLIIAGASAYPRRIDFQPFRQIADEVGAWLLADVSHVAGLIAGGEHPSPIDHAHVTTTSTYKQLFGPRGGLLLVGRDHALAVEGGSLAAALGRAVFPLLQSTPNLAAVAGKARALARAAQPAFRTWAQGTVANAQALAGALLQLGHRVITGGTDNHLLLIDVSQLGARDAERRLEAVGLIVNRNRLPGDRGGESGLRLGTNDLTARGMGTAEMVVCAQLIDRVLLAHEDVSEKVKELARRFPLPGHPR